ncbi:MAG TPA: ABC transporter ATP-binding protein [Bacteroidota bacterium]|nr:ABC transporter ATP-binding protein [Bacteroidota bacterium]
MGTVFRLLNIGVSFEKHAVTQRSFKSFLSGFLDGNGRPQFHALADVSLTIQEGEHVGIIGRNGAGKSTLLRVLSRIITPQRGSLYVNGSMRIVPLLELGIGFQPDLTGRENCYLAGVLMGYSQEEVRTKIDDIKEFAGLGEFFDEPVKTYSSGMFARLAFALATDVEPDILLVDEVFGVGDEFFMRKSIVRMQRLMQAGSTTVFVSHNLDFLVAQCSRLIWLDNGRVILDGTPDTVATAYRAQGGLD